MQASPLDGVRWTVERHVGELTLAEPDTRNAFSTSLLRGVHRGLDLAQQNPEVRVLLILAEGPHFSAGADLKSLMQAHAHDEETLVAHAQPIADLFRRVGDFPKPVVVGIQGAAIGGGFGLACAADLVVAASNARFSCPEVRLGLFPFLLMPALRKALGDRRALQLALTGEELNAEQALAAGVVGDVVAPSSLDAQARALAQQVARASPRALDLGMRAFRATTGHPWEQALQTQLRLRSRCLRGTDVREGVSAFLEKREPQWAPRQPTG
ncbi:enoyl-CoA hydratase/isomerase family protein [Hydrogenophaga sp. BPS33]|uniref:enoyl-CoA hydratase/isomerase family protein n=1 Tax=Hydrogenophaga sp. BPS33 TaxID=2651974 RepID=UPI001359E93B|nr:enoyl-CoA hydratase-related protein [Hydrogenophaga sp. BPS33]